ncbi:Protein CBR-DOD-24 [Caenorhabditis briggsae]|uniref:Protein CBR-DOD-24 n=1 Tax=Caenorhabditis briggsae TaxID=6238 RepID=A8WKK9_CAEBR|nr:Protein CBR-DOD-24 [Caenorhabditis briggsae]CAP21004.2 Protein CBR-DOD-24 [Caenorhabditis briggsae]
MNRFLFLLLASCVLGTSGYRCTNGTQVINPPTDLSTPTFFPFYWNGVDPVPYIEHEGPGCFLNVNVPSGYYANVTMFMRLDSSGNYVYYPNRKIVTLQNDDHHPFIFTNPYFKVSVSAANHTGPGTSEFAFKIIWTKFPDVKKNVIGIYKGQPPVAVIPNGELTTFRGDPSSMMSLIGFSLEDPSMNHLLRQTALFGGDSFNSDYIGTLDQVVKSKVYNTYEGINIPSSGNHNVYMNGVFGNHLTVTDYNGPEIIKEFITFPSTGTISIYENSISNTTCIATLTSSNYQQQLPLEVKGNMKFYSLIGNGFYEMVLTRDVSRAGRL